MKLFGQYIRQLRRSLLTASVFALIFLVTFILYDLPWAAVLYPALLCVVLGMILLLIDFRRIYIRHQILQSIRSRIDLISDIFPQPDGIEDEDYQNIIRLLYQAQNDFRNTLNRRYMDMIDYYTVWAHQIKTPIAAMRLNLQNEDSELSRKLNADLFRIEQYVEMVMMFLRLDADSTDYVIKPYDLDVLIRQAVKKFAGEFISRRLSLVYEPCHATVITDEKWLGFVIEQILSNALKYTRSGSITITLEPEKKLCIKDTGIGIAPEDLPRIFEKGFTGYNGHIDKIASGIGLYLCKRVCDNLGHKISAESVIDEGTVMTIDLMQAKLEHE